MKTAEAYRWSSHRSYVGKPPIWLTVDEVLERFGRRRSVAIREFRRFFSKKEQESRGILGSDLGYMV